MLIYFVQAKNEPFIMRKRKPSTEVKKDGKRNKVRLNSTHLQRAIVTRQIEYDFRHVALEYFKISKATCRINVSETRLLQFIS